MPKKPAKAKVKKPAKKNVKDFVDVKGFVMNAGIAVDPNPTEPDCEGDKYNATMSDKQKQKVIAGFYRICASPNFSRDSIQQYLIKKGFGGKSSKLHEDDWKHIKTIRDATETLFCGDPHIMY